MDFELVVTREQSTEHGTPGVIKSNRGFRCDSLELPWKNNRRGISCTMPDTYKAWIWWSPTLKRNVVRLEDKHRRENCLLHNANFAGGADGDFTQVHGCTAVGSGYGRIERPDGKGTQWGIKSSGTTLELLIQHIINEVGKDGKFTVRYEWAEGCEPEDMTDRNGEQP